jgi:hypothetical protein
MTSDRGHGAFRVRAFAIGISAIRTGQQRRFWHGPEATILASAAEHPEGTA